jgi:hypothetical protein
MKYMWMPSPLYQNIGNLIVDFPFWRYRSIFMHVLIFTSSVLSFVGAWTYQWPLSIMHNILSLTYSVPLTAEMILSKKKPLPNSRFSFTFLYKNVYFRFQCHRPPIWPPAPWLDLTCIWVIVSTLIRKLTLYIVCTFHVLNLMFVFHH